MNKWEGYGRLTKDPETRYTQTKNGEQMAITKASIAVNRRTKTQGGPDADFFDIQAFGKTAEVLGKYFHKGSRIALVGRVENNNWTDQQGAKHYGTIIRVEELDFVDTKAESGGQDAPAGPAPENAWLDVPEGLDNDLPFK